MPRALVCSPPKEPRGPNQCAPVIPLRQITVKRPIALALVFRTRPPAHRATVIGPLSAPTAAPKVRAGFSNTIAGDRKEKERLFSKLFSRLEIRRGRALLRARLGPP